jgi:hypothetical protein
MKVNGLEDSEMERVHRFGLMEQNTQGSGRIIELMDMEHLYMLMVMFTKATGSMIKLMVMVCICMSMGLDMKESGKMIFNMDTEKKHGQMDRSMKVNM